MRVSDIKTNDELVFVKPIEVSGEFYYDEVKFIKNEQGYMLREGPSKYLLTDMGEVKDFDKIRNPEWNIVLLSRFTKEILDEQENNDMTYNRCVFYCPDEIDYMTEPTATRKVKRIYFENDKTRKCMLFIHKNWKRKILIGFYGRWFEIDCEKESAHRLTENEYIKVGLGGRNLIID